MGDYKKYNRHNLTLYISDQKLYFSTELQTMLIYPKGQASAERIDVLAHLLRYNSIKDICSLVTYCDRNKLTYMNVSKKPWM